MPLLAACFPVLFRCLHLSSLLLAAALPELGDVRSMSAMQARADLQLLTVYFDRHDTCVNAWQVISKLKA